MPVETTKQTAWGSAAAKCSNRNDRCATNYDPHKPSDLRQRPSSTSLPLDGKEKVYGSIP